MNEEKAKALIRANLKNCLIDTDFLDFSGKKKGKVRDSYERGKSLLLITTDRQSAFDRILASIPFKGQVLNQVSAFWFDATKDIVPNHLISVPDPNAILAKECTVIPIEMVVRGYLTGSTNTSAWTLYNKGIREMCGNILPDGMVKNQKFNSPILTPTTKSDEHDEPMSPTEIVERGIVDQTTWDELAKIALTLFERGTEIAAQNGLILVDTKYELGIDKQGKITLIDEIHTPDSSRYWIAGSYEERFRAGEEPENIDKEFLRLWFREHCDPYKDKTLPDAPEELVIELAWRYIKLFQMITGQDFQIDSSPIQERLRANLVDI